MLPRLIEVLGNRLERTKIDQSEYTPIAAEARRTLSSWGMDRNQIRELQKLVKEFDGAYLNCRKKIESLGTLYIPERMKVAIPRFTVEGSLPNGGNCLDIAALLIERISASGLLDSVNAKRKEDDPIELRIARGSNKTHFNRGTHVWAALVKRSDVQLQNMVVLDGSYQEISHLKTNGYSLRKSEYLRDAKIEPIKELTVSFIVIGNDRIEDIDSAIDLVLGLSNDKSVSFGIGFAIRDMSISSSNPYFNTYVPFIRVGNVNGSDAAVFLINPNSGRINSSFNRDFFALTVDATAELESLLDAASHIQFILAQKNL